MQVFDGGLAVDGRGKVGFVNDFDFKDVKRFYTVENFEPRAIRAWHGHKKEAKYALVVSGSAMIAAVDMEDETEVDRYVLYADRPQVLYIPPGKYNGAMTLLPDTKILYFSTSTLEESKRDDFRKPFDKWIHVWSIES